MTNFPNFFNAGGVRYNLAGQGQQPCSRSYVCVQNGTMIEAFAGVVVSTGSRFVLARVPEAPGMGTIHIDASSMPGFQTLAPGQPVILAGLEYTPSGAHAGVVVPLRVATPTLETGVIASLQAPTWGWIHRDGDGARIFLHVSNLTGPFMAGQRLTFRSELTPKGLTAVNAHAVAGRPQPRAYQWR